MKLNSIEKKVKVLMVKDNSLYSWIFETETALKRDLTAEEKTRYIKETAHECMMLMIGLSCSLYEAYNTLMN